MMQCYYINLSESGDILEVSIRPSADLRNHYSEIRHLVFYRINEEDKLVIIYAIVDGRREYRNLI